MCPSAQFLYGSWTIYIAQTRPYISCAPHTQGRGTHLSEIREEDDGGDEDDGLLVDDVELLGDGGGGETRAEDGGAGLGEEAGGRRELVDELRRALGGGLRRGRGRHCAPVRVFFDVLCLLQKNEEKN